MPIPRIIYVNCCRGSHGVEQSEQNAFNLDLLLSEADKEEEDEMQQALQGKPFQSSRQISSDGLTNMKSDSRTRGVGNQLKSKKGHCYL